MKNENLRYELRYCSGATGYGWRKRVRSIAEVKKFIREFNSLTNRVEVWDSTRRDYIYFKRALDFYPETNLIEEV